jgi:hypothetical protein
MFITKETISVLAIGFATTASAFDVKILGAKVAFPKIAQTSTQIVPLCPDFTGNWKGTCEYTDGSTKEGESVVISQNKCKYISYDGLELAIGGTTSYSQIAPATNWNYATTISTSWNESHTKMHTLLTASLNGVSGFVIARSLKLEGEELHTNIDHWTPFIAVDGTTTDIGHETKCIYKKQN